MLPLFANPLLREPEPAEMPAYINIHRQRYTIYNMYIYIYIYLYVYMYMYIYILHINYYIYIYICM